ncbi:hypothetical protein [Nocardia brasiliensis]|uniref:hypothetical protein n=1 Tax=Nocardia brasiliensis TaxID=37326 RepID=UPI0011DE2B65|nr:hypothetical protein [Nocardia brasiliensis]
MTSRDGLATDHRYSLRVRETDAATRNWGRDACHRQFETTCGSSGYLVEESIVAVQGHYNHFDDPDEFWDEEPLEIRRPSVPHPAVPVSRSAVEFRPLVEPVPTRPSSARPERGESVEPDSGGSVEDVDLQQDQFERLRAVARRRIEAVMAEVRMQQFTGISSDRTATARVSSSGVVLDIELSNGFGDPRQPQWLVAEGIDSAARAIVEAVNAARVAAAQAVAGGFSDEFRHR